MFPKPAQNNKLPGNYRPISLLSNIGKVFEKAILARLKEECQELDIIPNEQYGFMANHGCIHQLLRVTNTITQGYNHKLYTEGVFLDVRKAFDRMWHNGIIYKLIQFKIPNYLIVILINLRNRNFRSNSTTPFQKLEVLKQELRREVSLVIYFTLSTPLISPGPTKL
ncbi:putative RNA-directed DNA polymerase from transposon X-element [Araneus ventricosus]|uniref:Putative RNA-directed DNA polymerase from transposon X-element n=1 Tax=Araneus ventricosus TaxID=182803 RepID=A0A4Y2K2I8_ARAVE|nr:putative RNA-directed DNA polymerase from transposon X-element [Araneus ventricosus]